MSDTQGNTQPGKERWAFSRAGQSGIRECQLSPGVRYGANRLTEAAYADVARSR